jgi:methylglutaconyl-CoA hydratase
MRRTAQYPPERNRADAVAMARMFARLEAFPAPTVAIVQGAAYGGGVGLVAACDIALASDDARFALSEVRLGLVPAVISPYLVAAVGQRACRRLFLTGEVFDAARALQLGLVHEVTTSASLGTARDRVVAGLLAGGPRATREAKALLRRLAGGDPGRGAASGQESPQGERLQAHTAALIAELRASAEGREGLAAFLEKRRPAWHPEATAAGGGA